MFPPAFWMVVIGPSLIVSDFRRGGLKYNTADYGFWVGRNTDSKRQAGSGRRKARGARREAQGGKRKALGALRLKNEQAGRCRPACVILVRSFRNLVSGLMDRP